MGAFLRAGVPALCVAVFAGWTFFLHGGPRIGIDDSNIFFTYSENLAAGKGLVYGQNPERVEGFSSVLWMLIGGLVFRLGFAERALLGLCVLLVIATQWVVLGAIRRLVASMGDGKSWPYEVGYLALVLASPAYISWSTITLMDTALWGLVLAGMTYGVLFPPATALGWSGAGAAFLLAPLTRPEGMLVAPLFVVQLWLRARAVRAPQRDWAPAALLGGVLAVTGAMTLFRLAYFGHPLPNTFYAKVSPSLLYNLTGGSKYGLKFLLASPLVVLMLIPLIWALRGLPRALLEAARRHGAGVLPRHGLALAIVLLLGLPVSMGGDHFGMFRFYQPVYPLICLLPVLWAISRPLPALEFRRGGALALVTAPIVLAGLGLFAFKESWAVLARGTSSSIAHEFRLAEEGLHDGRKLGALFAAAPRLPTVGVITAGGIARTYPGPLLDLMGLNSTAIAHFEGDRVGFPNHAAFEKEVFFTLSSDVLLARTDPFCKEVLKGLLDDPRFTEQWSFGVVSAVEEPSLSVQAFFAASFLAELRENAALDFQQTMAWSAGEWRREATPARSSL